MRISLFSPSKVNSRTCELVSSLPFSLLFFKLRSLSRLHLHRKLLRRFFDANPTYVDKVFLSVKGGGRSGHPQVRPLPSLASRLPPFDPDRALVSIDRRLPPKRHRRRHRSSRTSEEDRSLPVGTKRSTCRGDGSSLRQVHRGGEVRLHWIEVSDFPLIWLGTLANPSFFLLVCSEVSAATLRRAHAVRLSLPLCFGRVFLSLPSLTLSCLCVSSPRSTLSPPPKSKLPSGPSRRNSSRSSLPLRSSRSPSSDTRE